MQEEHMVFHLVEISSQFSGDQLGSCSPADVRKNVWCSILLNFQAKIGVTSGVLGLQSTVLQMCE